jgi:PAS domain S-box-containing protein
MTESDHAPLAAMPGLMPTIVEMAGSVLLALTPDHRIVEWNREAERLYQTPREQALGMDYVATFIAPEHRAPVAADIVEVLDGKRTLHFEDDSILPDGSRRTLIWNVTRFLAPDGSPAGIIAIGQDITDRKEAEERFRLVFEHATDGLLISERGYVIDCNPEVLRILGLQHKEQLIGRRPAEFSPARQPDGSLSEEKSRALGAMTSAVGELRFEWVHQRPDGTEVPVEVHVRHAMLAGRKVSVVSWYDLSPRYELEREQRELQQRLALAQKMEAVGQLAGGIAHDFNNMLTAIRNAVDLARTEIGASPHALQDLQMAADVTDRAAALTKQLLSLSRREIGDASPVDMRLLVQETLRLLRPTVPPGILLHESLPDDTIVVDGDRSSFEQVLMNLVLNAKDAMPSGGRLNISLSGEPEWVTLAVSDTGVGMTADVLAKVFDPFFSTKPAGQGTGLGLSVVYGVVTGRGGSVDATSSPGEGTTFTVRLPRSRRELVGPSLARGARPVAHGCVLLVDDDPTVRRTTRRLLERAGWQVVEANDGASGLAEFSADPGRFRVVLSDVRMPMMSGPALARRIQSLVPGTPIVLFSGYDRLDGPDDSLPVGIPLLHKPFAPSDLLRMVDEAARATNG